MQPPDREQEGEGAKDLGPLLKKHSLGHYHLWPSGDEVAE